MSTTIIDNGGADYADVGAGWISSGYGYAGGQRYNGSNDAAQYATFTLTGLTAGATYRLSMTWYDSSAYSTATPWQVLDASHADAVLTSGTINQSIAPSGTSYGGRPFQFFAASLTLPVGTTSLKVKLSAAAGAGKYATADAVGIQPASDPYAIASAQAGDWGTGATWIGGSAPGAGANVSISHAVTVTSAQVCGDGTASTVLTVGTTSGTLTITGATLTVKGNMAIGASTGALSRDVLVLNPVSTTPGELVLYGNSGVTPTLTMASDTRIVCNGTSSGHCHIRSADTGKGDAASNAGSNAIITGGSNPASTYWLCTYTDFYKLGDATHIGISAANVDAGLAGTCKFDHCNFDTCGQTPAIVLPSGTGDVDCQLTHCSWTNCLATASTTPTGCMSVNAAAAIGTGTRLIDSCIFASGPSLTAPRDFTITNCVFVDGIVSDSASSPLALFDGNLVIRHQDGTEWVIPQGQLSNNYFYDDGVTDNALYLLSSTGSGGGLQLLANVAEYAGTGHQY